MRLLFLYGPPAAGKYTIARRVADATGLPLFHNHLVVDAVGAVFPFGSPAFAALREKFWLDVFRAAGAEKRSLIFTFQPEPSVSESFASRVADMVHAAGGDVTFVRLLASLEAQRTRIANTDRAAFGKLRDAALLQELHPQFLACEEAMPEPDLVIDTDTAAPEEAATLIAALMRG